MWSPTHVQVTVQKARGLLLKGKGSNDCFVTIALGKDKFQTSVKERAPESVEWHEECELAIPSQGNTAAVVLTVLHHGFLGVDEFLGQVTIPLAELDVYERPKNRWFKLQSKGDKKKDKERGELEVRVGFIVKAGSLTDLSKRDKHKSSLSKLAGSVGGSLLSIGTFEKRKGLKKFAKSLGSKVHLNRKSKLDKEPLPENGGSTFSIGDGTGDLRNDQGQLPGEADPGVISEDEDEFTFDDLSHKSSGSSLNVASPGTSMSSTVTTALPISSLAAPPMPSHALSASAENVSMMSTSPSSGVTSTTNAGGPRKPPRVLSAGEHMDEWEQKLYGKHSDNLLTNSTDSLKRRSWAVTHAPQPEDINNPFIEAESKRQDVVGSSGSLPDITVSPAASRAAGGDGGSRPPQPKPRASPLAEQRNTPPAKIKEDKDTKEGIFSKKLKYFKKDKHVDDKMLGERIIIGGENESTKAKKYSSVPHEILQKYEGKTREEVIAVAHGLQGEVALYRQKCRELEDYLDGLLLRVMETTPRILQNPYAVKAGSTKSG